MELSRHQAHRLVATRQLDPRAVRVPGRELACPICDTSAWYAPRSFPGHETSYWLCKWCGYRWVLADGPENSTLALPVYHRCSDEHCLLTWHQFEGEPYGEKSWTCHCGAQLLVLSSLRPFPRFGSEPWLIELPGE